MNEIDNLEPMTIKEQKELCEDLIYLKYEKEAKNYSYLIDEYYESVYDEFMNIKKANTYFPMLLIEAFNQMLGKRNKR